LRRFALYFGDDFTIEHPTGSGNEKTLDEIADDLADRLVSIFRNDASGRRPVFGGYERFQSDPAWHDLLPSTSTSTATPGAGLGASHQTGWTGLVADRLIASARHRERRHLRRPQHLTASRARGETAESNAQDVAGDGDGGVQGELARYAFCGESEQHEVSGYDTGKPHAEPSQRRDVHGTARKTQRCGHDDEGYSGPRFVAVPHPARRNSGSRPGLYANELC
jgi:hypothetical protein